MNLTQLSIKFPVTVIVGVLIAVISGFIALKTVPVQLTPEVERPVINVLTVWPGASPNEIEKEIIDKQEKYLKSLEGVLRMTSTSSSGSGSITLEFPAGTDLSATYIRVSNKLNEVPGYPENADQPTITTSGPFDNAIAWFVIRTTDSTVYLPHMKTFIEDMVKPRLERIIGISSINTFGGLEQELHVIFEPDMLASSGITINQLINALRSENRDISAGDFSEGKRRYVVRTIARYETLEAVEQTIVATKNGVPIRVIDIAEVKLAYEKPSAQVNYFGETVIAFNAQRQVGANVIEVMDRLLIEAEKINKEIMEPRGMEIKNVYSQTVYINSAIDLVFSNIYLGGFLAILTLFLFLRSKSAIIVIGLSIPISIIATFLALRIFGRSINVISLAGMAFAVGMVVDSSIVVLENIYRHLQMGKARFQAALDAAREVWGALLASTVTTVAVFLPIMFIEERAGQLFKDIAIAICSAIAIALIVSITVIPSLSARILRIPAKLENDSSKKSYLNRFADKIAAFVNFINLSNTRRLATISGIVILSIGLTWLLIPDAEYLPNGNQNFVFGMLFPPPGYNIDEVKSIGNKIEEQLSYLYPSDTTSKDLPAGGVDNFFFVSTPNRAFMGLRAKEPQRARELVPISNQVLHTIPGSFGFANQASIFGAGFAGTRSIQIDVTGPEFTTIIGLAQNIMQTLPQALPGAYPSPVTAIDLGSPEVQLYPDRARAADAGLTVSEIGQSVNAMVDGVIVSEYFHNENEIDLVLKADDNWTEHTQNIAQLPIATPKGKLITVGDVATIEQQQGPIQISHVERQRVVSLRTSVPDEIALEKAMNLINDKIIRPLRESNQIGNLYDINLSGTADDLSKLRKEIFTGFNLAILLTYLLLSALFQSFTYPLVVMLTVPLAIFGGVLGLNIVQIFDSSQQLDILTMLGFVILVGTVINNSILIVYHAIHLMRDGMDAHSAVKESVRVRVRPIFMSTATSALAMMPLIIMPGAGSELYRGLGSVVVGGLAVSTIITLILTPLIFTYAIEFVDRLRSLFKLSGQTNN
ncbi:MAG: efflux RND transporter permease subunit [candidate division Zixibacteria bacterium]